MSDIEALVAFITARLDEDEAEAKAAELGVWQPLRLRREVAAKRGRLALMTEAQAEMNAALSDKHAGDVDRAMKIGRARGATVAVKWDATVWNDHPDYRPEWKP